MLRAISTSGGDTYEASHLCHYPGCANPEHIYVESRAMNTLRNSCVGLFAWQVVNGATTTILNPCPHREQTAGRHAHKECVLPVLRVDMAVTPYLYRPPGFLGAGQV